MIIGKDWGEAQFLQDPLTAGVIAGTSLLGSAMGSRSAEKAAEAQADAAERASEIELQMFREGQAATAPWRETGERALSQLEVLYGLPSAGGMRAPVAPTMPTRGEGGSRFANMLFDMQYNKDLGQYELDQAQYDQDLAAYNDQMAETSRSPLYGALAPGGFEVSFEDYQQSPGYQFQLEEAMRGAERSASARGLAGGNLSRRFGEIAQGHAATDFANYESRKRNELFDYVRGLQSLAGVGQTTAAQGAQMGSQVASNIGAYTQQAGAAAAQNQIAQGNIQANLIGQGAQLYGMYQGGYFQPPVNPGYGGGAYGLPPSSAPAGSYGLMVA